ncbi:MAG: hypothetical protein K2Q33_00565 [Gammaproteobacteria bacterium]|nr:hypothetical protein [Gammaproteobacteria bacterium]
MSWVKILIVGSLPILYKLVNNLWQWRELALYQKAYMKYLAVSVTMNSIKDYKLSDKERSILDKIQGSKSKIIDLFKKAELESPLVPVMKDIGLGYSKQVKVDIFENLDMTLIVVDTNIPGLILKSFTRGIGVYKQRAIEAINPLWWINLVVFLPERLVCYLGISVENNSHIRLVAKTLNITYWFISVILWFLVSIHYGYITIGHLNISIS